MEDSCLHCASGTSLKASVSERSANGDAQVSCLIWSRWSGFACLSRHVLYCLILGGAALFWERGLFYGCWEFPVLRRWVGGYSAGVKSYVQGGAEREWRVRLGQDMASLGGWGGMRSRGQRFGKQETRKVCVFIIRTEKKTCEGDRFF